MVCYVYNKNTKEKVRYIQATYTNINNRFGYVCLDGDVVRFFYECGGNVCCDELKDYSVIYERI